jgi:MoaA/NifB/PqqE/SkfB family radical SAM enzyme
MGPNQWFQENLANIRLAMLQGQPPGECHNCQLMEQHGKVSGRQKQLLKVGVTQQEFVPQIQSSPWLPVFARSMESNGLTDQLPQDWQIDLGNFCNSACVFCSPHSSSRLATEYQKLGLLKSPVPRSWTDDPNLVAKFMQDLTQAPTLRYLHFIGGETLITPAFKTILQSLIHHGLHRNVTVGFTTNLTVWRQDIVDLLSQFDSVNLGMSVECLHAVNDYARYPSDIEQVQSIMSRWLDKCSELGWLPQIRITPTVLTVLHLDTIYKYALQNKIAVESCNFLDEPHFMRASVLPQNLRNLALAKLQDLNFEDAAADQIINTRNPDTHRAQLYQDCQSYINYLTHAPDESHRLPELIAYLKILENHRGNCVLDYLPEYEDFFRSAGY